MNAFKFLPLFLFVFLMVFLWKALSYHPAEIPSPLIDKKVPEFSLPNLMDDKKFFSNRDLTGHVSLVTVWATWCPACLEEHDMLMQISHENGFVMYGVDYKDDEDEAKTWLRHHGNPYSQIGFDSDGQAAIDLGVYGIPETFIIDKKGMIRYRQVGGITNENWTSILKPLIDTLARESV